MDVNDQKCRNCKHKKLSMLVEPCKDCHWDIDDGFTYWEFAEPEETEDETGESTNKAL